MTYRLNSISRTLALALTTWGAASAVWAQTASDLAPISKVAEQAIARQRVSEDGQEGLRAFLERRPPSWHATEPGRA